MQDKNRLFIQKLKANGLSHTAARQKVFSELIDAGHKPVSVSELISRLSPSVDRATVYRIVEAFEKSGITRRISSGWKYKIELSEDFHGHHHHLSCVVCGKISVIKDEKNIDQLLKQIAEKENHQLLEHSLELKGTCSYCRVY